MRTLSKSQALEIADILLDGWSRATSSDKTDLARYLVGVETSRDHIMAVVNTYFARYEYPHPLSLWTGPKHDDKVWSRLMNSMPSVYLTDDAVVASGVPTRVETIESWSSALKRGVRVIHLPREDIPQRYLGEGALTTLESQSTNFFYNAHFRALARVCLDESPSDSNYKSLVDAVTRSPVMNEQNYCLLSRDHVRERMLGEEWFLSYPTGTICENYALAVEVTAELYVVWNGEAWFVVDTHRLNAVRHWKLDCESTIIDEETRS